MDSSDSPSSYAGVLTGLTEFRREQVLVFLVFTVVAIPLWYERWRRFGNYRVVTAAARWLAAAPHEERPKSS